MYDDDLNVKHFLKLPPKKSDLPQFGGMKFQLWPLLQMLCIVLFVNALKLFCLIFTIFPIATPPSNKQNGSCKY